MEDNLVYEYMFGCQRFLVFDIYGQAMMGEEIRTQYGLGNFRNYKGPREKVIPDPKGHFFVTKSRNKAAIRVKTLCCSFWASSLEWGGPKPLHLYQ